MITMSFEFLISQCAPTLAGIKVGNLFSYTIKDGEDFQYKLAKLNQLFNGKGVFFKILRHVNNQVLLYVYRKNQLENVLKDKDIITFLSEYNYVDFTIDGCLDILTEHLKQKDFPHEIGIFLGYPLYDIRSFILHKGLNYKCVGCWKVYSDECSAQKTFAKFNKCKEIYCKKYAEGFDIFKLTVAS